MGNKEKKAEVEKPRELDPKLKDFIDRAIVPALMEEWIAKAKTKRC